MPPRVTVITATYNASALLALSLRSLLAQEFTDFEAWVIGDACTDDSEAVVAAFGDSRLHWVNLSANSGSQAAPNNAGLDRARGDLVAYLGHDDLWFPWHLGELTATLDRTAADLVHGLAAIVDREGPYVAVGPPPPGLTYRDHFVPPSTWLHRRVVAQDWARWRDPSALGWAVDVDVLRRATAAGARFACAPRLSVLKFPSAFFRAYARRDGVPPEAPWLANLERDPLALERRVLTEVALATARHPHQYLGRFETDGQLLRRALYVSLRRRVVDPFRGSPLVAPLLRRWFQRRRRRVRRDRGLE
jgi:hypothetical protein